MKKRNRLWAVLLTIAMLIFECRSLPVQAGEGAMPPKLGGNTEAEIETGTMAKEAAEEYGQYIDQNVCLKELEETKKTEGATETISRGKAETGTEGLAKEELEQSDKAGEILQISQDTEAVETTVLQTNGLGEPKGKSTGAGLQAGPQVITVTDFASFLAAVTEQIKGDVFTPAYVFEKNSSKARINGKKMEMLFPCMKQDGKLSVPEAVFQSDPSVDQAKIADGDGVVSIEAAAKASAYEAVETEATAQLMNPYQSRRLIVTSPQGFDPYGAGLIIQGFENLYILFYDTEEETKAAYDALKEVSYLTVERDTVLETAAEAGKEEIEGRAVSEGAEENGEGKETELGKFIRGHRKEEAQVIVAVVDTGVNETEGLKGRLAGSLSYLIPEESPKDENGHGTQMAEIIAKDTPSNVRILPVKAADKEGHISILRLYLAIRQAADAAELINISLGGYVLKQSALVEQAINNAAKKGIITVVAAGNSGADARNYSPANVKGAFTIAAAEDDGKLAEYSNHGELIDYGAYGTEMVRNAQGKETRVRGTSVAAAKACAVFAMLRLCGISKQSKLKRTLNQYAIKEEGKTQLGNGLISFTLREGEASGDGRKQKTLLQYEDLMVLTGEELTKAFDNSSPYEQAYIIQKASEEELSYFIEKVPMLSDQTVEEFCADKVYGPQDTYIPYHAWLKELDISGYTPNGNGYGTNAGRKDGGHFYLSMYDKYHKKMSKVKLILTVPNANADTDSSYTIHIGAAWERNDLGVGFSLGQTSLATLPIKVTYADETEGYEYADGVIGFAWTKPAYTQLRNDYEGNYTGARFNFNSYDRDSASTVSTISYTGEGTSVTGNVQFQLSQTGLIFAEDKQWHHANAILQVTRYFNPLYVMDRYLDEADKSTWHELGRHNMGNFEWGTIISCAYTAAQAGTYPGYHWAAATEDARMGMKEGKVVYNKYKPNTYKIQYDGNGATSGSTAGSSHKYDVWKKLTVNGYIRQYCAAYDGNGGTAGKSGDSLTAPFAGWNTSPAGNGTGYNDGQNVVNLTAEDGGAVSLYAQWNPATGVTPGAVRAGYKLKGWKRSDNGQLIGVNESYQTTENITFTAQWEPETYRIRLDNQQANIKDGTPVVYQKFTVGYFQDAKAINQFSNNRIALPEKYISDENLYGGKRKLEFFGYYTEKKGSGVKLVSREGKLVSNMANKGDYRYFTSNSTVYAWWKNMYAVQFNPNLTEGKDPVTIEQVSLSNNWNPYWKSEREAYTVTYEEPVVTDEDWNKIYRFQGWSLTPTITEEDEMILTKEKPSYTFTDNEDVTLYAQWDTDFNVSYVGNKQSQGKDHTQMENSLYETYTFQSNDKEEAAALDWADYYEKTTEKPTIDIRTGEAVDENGEPYMETVPYSFQGWSMYEERSKQEDDVVYIKEEGEQDCKKLLKKAQAPELKSKGLGLTVGMPVEAYGTYDAPHEQEKKLFGADEKKSFKEFTPEDIIRSYQNEVSRVPYVNMFAIWDEFPQIEAEDRYFNLEYAKEGKITEEILLESVKGTDLEDGALENGKDVTVINFSPKELKQFTDSGSTTITYRATDSVGNVTEKTITVYVSDGTPKSNSHVQYARFLDEKYYKAKSGEGGLNINSLWKTEKSYQAQLEKAFANLKNDTPEQIYTFPHDKVLEIQDYVKKHGVGNSLDKKALQGFVTTFM